VIELDLSPERSKLRGFGFVALALCSLLSLLVLWRGSLVGFELGSATRPVAAVIAGFGLVTGLLSVFAPAANRLPWVALVLVTWPIGFVVSHVVLIVLYYGLITPVGLALRATGRDPLHRRIEPGAPSHWTQRGEPSAVARYFKQF